jgi:hypothetical protein
MKVRQRLRNAVFVCTLAAATASGQQARIRPESEQDSLCVLKEAEDLASAREQMGQRLTAVFADSELPVAERLHAARLLGDLHYVPAIDVLIRHVDLVDPSVDASKSNPRLTHPVTTALAAYRNAAVPRLVDAFLEERNRRKQDLLHRAIQYGKTTDFARSYLRGIPPIRDDDGLDADGSYPADVEQRTRNMERLVTLLMLAR